MNLFTQAQTKADAQRNQAPGGSPASSVQCPELGTAAAALIAVEIARHDFSARDRRLLEIIRQVGFGRGETEAYIPGLRYFAQSVGMSEGHVSVILRKLKRCQVIEEAPRDFYGFVLPVSLWKVPLLIDLSALGEVLELTYTSERLRGALRVTYLESCATELFSKSGGVSPASARASEVPESGTSEREVPADFAVGVPQSGTKTGVPPDSTPKVPESGTLEQRIERLRQLSAKKVPLSGTLHEKPASKAPDEVPLFGTPAETAADVPPAWAPKVPESGTSPGPWGPGTPVPNVSETFNRFVQKRINVQNVLTGTPGSTTAPEPGCENFANRLMERVRAFVGEADWANLKFWNFGRGWQARFFTDPREAPRLSAALHFVKDGLQTGEIILKKTPGALLWYEFQRRRREA